MSEEKTYEMLWDCAYCGQKKLLGKSQRHCPNCGAPQDAEKRYFPPEDEKVAVEDHEFVGSDLDCPACSEAQSSAARCCTNCGSPLTEGAAVQKVADQVVGADGQLEGAAGASPHKKSKVGLVVAAVALLLVALIAVRFLWKKDAALVVEGHAWKREVVVEVYRATEKTSECASVPKDAKVLSREKKQPPCKTRKVDQGDGTYKEKKECPPPVENCRYSVTGWDKERNQVSENPGLDQAPAWPVVKLKREGKCEGCERAVRRERFLVKLRDTKTKETHSCSYEQKAKAQRFSQGTKLKGKVFALDDALDCSSLTPQ